MFKIGVDIGGTKINIGLFDSERKCLIASRKTYIADVEDLSVYIVSVVEALCNESSISFNSVSSCGIGIPGTVSGDGRRILKAPNYSNPRKFSHSDSRTNVHNQPF